MVQIELAFSTAVLRDSKSERSHLESTIILFREVFRLNPKVKRLLYISSIASIGIVGGGVTVDENYPLSTDQPDLYGALKAQTEIHLLSLVKQGIPITIIRPAVILGIGSVWTSTMLQQLQTGTFNFIASGKLQSPCIYIDNMIFQMVLMLSNDKAIGQAYLSSDNTMHFKEYINRLAKECGITFKEKDISPRAARIFSGVTSWIAWALSVPPIIPPIFVELFSEMDVRVTMDKAKKDLGYHSVVSYDQHFAIVAKYQKASNKT